MACPWWTELGSWQLLLGRLGHLQREPLGQQEHPEPLGQQEHLQPEHREHLGQKGHRELQERREPMEPLVRLEQQEHLALLEHRQVRPEQKAWKEQKQLAPQELLERPVHPER